MNRVVITGVGAVTPLGKGVPALMQGLAEGRSAVRRMEGWEQYKGLRSLVAAPSDLVDERLIPRQQRRSMGRMSLFAAQAAEEALADAALDPGVVASSGRLGCVIGSTTGSAISLNQVFETMLPARDLTQLTSMMFFQCLSHTAAMNVGQFLGLRGMTLATCSACCSALQAIGAGYDAIRLGRQDLMLCGGAEEIHPTVTGSFDMLMATSIGYNDRPAETPRPFDRDRDGLVCGDGAGVLLLEERDRAIARGARIHAEIAGYHTCTSGTHVSESNREAVAECMRGALDQAGIGASEVDYVNAHATATRQGDAEEAAAIREVFGGETPVSSLKGYLGHTLGASGAIELIASLGMMARGVILPTLNLRTVADDCAGVRHVTAAERRQVGTVLKNSFAFGGINACLVCRRAGRAGGGG
jgi:3-oxoacyl-[acyl-carrier-protein] synthase II